MVRYIDTQATHVTVLDSIDSVEDPIVHSTTQRQIGTFLFLFLQDRGSLCSLDCPATQSVNLSGLYLRD